MLVGLDFGTRSFFTDRLDAESDFLFFLIHLDDFEVVLVSRLESQGLAIGIHGFGIVAKTLDALRDFHECAEASHAQDFAVQHIANFVLAEEAFPHIWLQLLYA
jgi:hypothetical protein